MEAAAEEQIKTLTESADEPVETEEAQVAPQEAEEAQVEPQEAEVETKEEVKDDDATAE